MWTPAPGFDPSCPNAAARVTLPLEVFVSLGRSIAMHPAPTYVDEDGRPVAEVGAEVVGTAETERAPCPYADRRRGAPMNRSALRQLGPLWPQVRAALASYAGDGPVTLRGAFTAAVCGTAAVVVHAGAHPGEPAPRELGALYKASLGLGQVFGALVLADPDAGDAPLGSLGDGEAFFTFLDQGEWLLGQVEVCAGPRAMFVEVFDALSAGSGPRPAWAAEVVRAVATIGAALVAAPEVHAEAPHLARLLGPKGPSWVKALHAAPQRDPAVAAWWLEPGDPARDEVVAFAASVAGRSPAEVEAALFARL